MNEIKILRDCTIKAIEYLDKIQYPADGLVTLLESFEVEMRAYKGQIDEYSLSHPVSRKRIDLIKSRTAGKNYSDKKINQKLQKSMDFILAKFEGFMENPDVILQKYQNKNDEFSNYKKSLAFFKKGRVDESLKLLDKIIALNPKNGFLYETKGQILFETGNVSPYVYRFWCQSFNLTASQMAHRTSPSTRTIQRRFY